MSESKPRSRRRLRAIARFLSLRRAGARAAQRYLRYLTRPERIRPRNRVLPLRGGEQAFPRMLAAIAGARRTIDMEIYTIRADGVGERFRSALEERARAGVTVRLMYDALGSFGLPDAFASSLEAAGAKVSVYAPLAPWRRRFGWNKRDHQKILIVDDRIAFTGGLNVTDQYVPVEEGGGGWFDVHAELEGPAVQDLARLFRRNWIHAGGDMFDKREPPEFVDPPGGMPSTAVQVISNAQMRSRSHMRHAYLRAIRHADRAISVMNAYFIPDSGLRRAFARSARRGVSVRVIVPSVSDVRAVYFASRHLYARLMRSGVRIFEWPERMMHAKSAVIDEIWTTIGSYNLDRRSMKHNLEVAIIVIDRTIGDSMQAQFELELARCREILPAEWEQRSWWEKWREWIYYQFRYWL